MSGPLLENQTFILSEPVLGDSLNNETSATQRSIEIYQIPTFLVVLLTIFYLGVSLCAVIGNSMVLWIVIKSKRMRNVTNFFIANLALSDITIGAFAIPFQFQAALLQKWVLPYFMCSFCPTVQVVSLNVSIFTLVANSLDRHQAITKPLSPRMEKTKAIIVILLIWIFSCFLAIPSFIAWKVQQVWNEDTQSYSEPFCDTTEISPDLWRTYNHILVALQYFFPLFVISFTYIHMAIKLNTRDETIVSRSDSRRALHNKKKVTKMLFMVVVLFAISWLPFQLYNILQEIYPTINEYKYINLIWFCCHWLAMSNSCYNPFIYAIYGERFRAEFQQRFYIFCFWTTCYNNGPLKDQNTMELTKTCTEIIPPSSNNSTHLIEKKRKVLSMKAA